LSILSNLLNSDRRLIMTHFHPIGARRVFPCWDEPAYKASFNISIKHFNYYKALSNMPVRKKEKDPKMIYLKEEHYTTTMTLTHFHQTPKISTYLVAIMLSESGYTPDEAKGLRYYTSFSDLDKEFTDKVIKFVTIFYYFCKHNFLHHSYKCPKLRFINIFSFM